MGCCKSSQAAYVGSCTKDVEPKESSQEKDATPTAQTEAPVQQHLNGAASSSKQNKENEQHLQNGGASSSKQNKQNGVKLNKSKQSKQARPNPDPTNDEDVLQDPEVWTVIPKKQDEVDGRQARGAQNLSTSRKGEVTGVHRNVDIRSEDRTKGSTAVSSHAMNTNAGIGPDPPLISATEREALKKLDPNQFLAIMALGGMEIRSRNEELDEELSPRIKDLSSTEFRDVEDVCMQPEDLKHAFD
mmetsp:Transcript_81772/g.128747  ORF Transcript_81772/g.128747 Transcript_81772/m.128747 type:complete len:244 (-) Transcript_81772:52-783(-)